MTEANFKSLQNRHEALLQKQSNLSDEDKKGFIKDVKEYIEDAKKGGSMIPANRERDQLRANLRYWANYIYSVEGNFPDTELAPSTVENKKISINVIGAIAALIVILLVAIPAIRSGLNNATETPSDTPISGETQTATTNITEAPVTVPAVVSTSTSVFVGSDVAFTSPENGENIPPKVVFKGKYTNLKAESTIHVLLIRSDRLYPIKDYYSITPESSTGDWEIPAALFLDPEELAKAETLAVVPAACFDNSCREKLANAVETGISIDELPSQFSFNLYRDSSRVVYRNAYRAVQETRLVYSMSLNETSYDLYTSRPDGSDVTQITITPNVSEIFPNISPDGTKIVYVKRFRETSSSPHIYAISIMDANGENDHEITDWTRNVIETPQWSPDSSYIAYAVGDISQSSNNAYWNIHIYGLSTHNNTLIFAESERFDQRYFAWLPDTNSIIFGARPQTTGTVGFDLVDINSSEESTFFFDTDQDDIRPSIKFFENGYLLTYTVVNPDKTHDIYAVMDSDREFPFDGSPIRLTFRRAGEMVDGVRIGSADYPIPDPASNSIYYIRNVNIYRLEFTMREGKMELNETRNSDRERYGDLVIETGLKDDIWGFDVGFMEAFFPIK